VVQTVRVADRPQKKPEMDSLMRVKLLEMVAKIIIKEVHLNEEIY
jgi:hypothetical protein